MLQAILELLLRPILLPIEFLSKKITSLFFGEKVFKNATIFHDIFIIFLTVIFITIVFGLLVLVIDYVW